MPMTVTQGDNGLPLKLKPINKAGTVATDITAASLKLKLKGSANPAVTRSMTVNNSEPEYKLSYTFISDDFATAGTLLCTVIITRQNGSVMTVQKPIQIQIMSTE
jgi:hypothetical protein